MKSLPMWGVRDPRTTHQPNRLITRKGRISLRNCTPSYVGEDQLAHPDTTSSLHTAKSCMPIVDVIVAKADMAVHRYNPEQELAQLAH